MVRDQPHPSFGDGSRATEQLWSAVLAGQVEGKGGEGQEETRITRRGMRGEEVGQAEEELCREEDTEEGGVQRRERALLQEQPPRAARPEPISPSSC